MCYDKNMNNLLQRILNCTESNEMRRLLKGASSCQNCPEEEKPFECACRRQQQNNLQNLMAHISDQKQV